MKNFILILQFMTRIPININLKVERENFQKGVAFFPLVGLIVGAFEASIFYISSRIVPFNTSIFVTVISHVVITGAIHIDGLGDTIDGIFSGRSKEKILEIMKDSRVGTFGALGIIFLIAGKIITLSSINSIEIYKGIILAPIISRTLITLLMYKRKYAREKEGMGDLFIGVLEKKNFIIALLTGIMLISIIGRIQGVVLLSICFFFTILFRNYIEKRIGGITGDILGASVELNELLVFLIYSSYLF
ncbi:adenosylcobinamide-GDP ribazoletransferase [Clostridium sp. 'White wine YQ']|uniref:adenosylcobinamide-GDP ribazoletransferase n=1 Tax=Clostridium sp. 'White wine YQ' TaxID=3027474 RepID=UPI002366617B|nr:adenosylcobinamide-GDP ribazoletransferase [Clostridium sp. 'White wine YQ']MDD7794989.1 adenosylcobinamide-GDP ribazoletransferase [Clostridium sp. 'White wine YQ']